MFQKILVALDNSDMGEQIFREAVLLAKASDAHLLLLHVLSDDEIGYPDVHDLSEHLTRWEASKQRGLALLQSRQVEALRAGVKAEFHQIPGGSGRTICAIAKEWQADVILVGHRGLSGMQELIQGSVSNYLVHHAHCSVLTVLGQAEPALKQILVAVDGSKESRDAFDAALDLAKAAGAKLQLVNVISVEDEGSPSLFSLGDPDFERQWETFAKPSMELLRSHQAIARDAGVTADVHQKLCRNTGRAICDLAHTLQVDLIVVGRRGISGLSELLMGSVSNYVTHYATSAVLIVQGRTKAAAKPTAPKDTHLAGAF